MCFLYINKYAMLEGIFSGDGRPTAPLKLFQIRRRNAYVSSKKSTPAKKSTQYSWLIPRNHDEVWRIQTRHTISNSRET